MSETKQTRKEKFKTFILVLLSFSIGVMSVLVVSCLLMDEEDLIDSHPVFQQEYINLSYREANLYWLEGYPLPEERMEIFYEVVDTLSDDINERFQIENFQMEVYYLGAPGSYYDLLDKTHETLALETYGTIFLSEEVITPQVNHAFFAMALVHEYVHVVQHYEPEYLEQYAQDVGWEKIPTGFSYSKENPNYTKVLSSYARKNPWEDMAVSYMFYYLCGNNLDNLSQERFEYAYDFWGAPQEEVCKNFP
jgi:hypothetical protein